MRRHLLLLIVLAVVMNAHAADTLSVAARSYECAIAWQQLWLRYTDQVALHHRQYRNPLSSFAARYEGRNETEPLYDEQGRGESIARLQAKTYLLPSTKEHLWGYADYANGCAKEVKWRSTSDYDRLYPYIMADEKGGDLLLERYAFGGGYSHQLSLLRLSGELYYRSQQEYRAVDPRPRSIVSDLRLSTGLSLPVAAYEVGLSLDYGLYKQRSGVAIYSPIGGSLQRLMSGLGGSFRRFDTNEPSLHYRGRSLGAALHLLPRTSDEGMRTLLGYRYSRLEQAVSDMNEVPIHHYTDHQGRLSIGYQHRVGVLMGALDLEASVESRSGVEHIVGEPKAGTYPVVGYNANFHRGTVEGKLSLSLGDADYRLPGWHWLVQPEVVYLHLRTRVLEPEKELRLDRWHVVLYGEVSHRRERSYGLLSLEAGYAPEAVGLLTLPMAEMEESVTDHLRQSYRSATASCLSLSIAPKYHLPMPLKPSWGLEVGGRYRLDHFPSSLRHTLLAEIQLTL